MKLVRNGPYWLLVMLSCLWLGTTVVAPWMASHGAGSVWDRVANWLYVLYAPVCHQISERSFQCFGHPLTACHRCLGLYAGFLLGLLILPGLPRLTAWLADYPRRMGYFMLPMLADYFLWQNVWWSRTLSGMLAALPVGLFVWAALTQLASDRGTVATGAIARQAPQTTGRPLANGSSTEIERTS